MHTPQARERWRKVDRALDGSGYALMLHCTREGRPEKATLWREYRQFKDNLKRPKPALFFVATYDSLLEVFNSDKAEADRIRALPIPVHENRSTWGDIRVDARLARMILELTCEISLIEAKSLLDEEALEMVRGVIRVDRRIAEERSGGVDDQCMHDGILDSSDAAAERRRMRRQEREAMWRDELRKVLGGGTWFDDWSQHGVVRTDWWQRRAHLLDTGGGTTNVTRLSRILPSIKQDAIRRCLQKLACPGCTERGSQMPLLWFSSERGHDFWAWAEDHVAAVDRARAAQSRMHGRYQRSGAPTKTRPPHPMG